MRDTLFTNDPVERIEVLDYIELGHRITAWACDPRSRPRTLKALRAQLKGVALLPVTVESFSFHDEVPEHLTILLPDPESVLIKAEELEDPFRPTDYELPRFYSEHFCLSSGPVLTPLDMFHARIADRSLAHLT